MGWKKKKKKKKNLPLLRVVPSAQQISVLPECVCFPSGSLPELLASFVFYFISERRFVYIVFLYLFFRSCLCCCVIVPGTLAFHLLDTWICVVFFVSLCLTVSDHRISIYLSRIGNQDGHYYCGCADEAVGRKDNLM